MTLRQKTLDGLKWSFMDSFANQGIQFVTGVILARLLVPRDFGLVGMLTFFLAVAQIFIEGGFSQALIRKQDCRQDDFNTVFFFNLAVGSGIYLALFFGAGWIAGFFREPRLAPLVRALGLVLIISAIGQVQKTMIVKDIDFKLKTRVSLVASLVSGAAGIGLALKGYGVWSLVCKALVMQSVSVLLFWMWKRWRPTLAVSARAFKEMFGFGSKLLASGLIDATYHNVTPLVIGKVFSATDLGFFIKAEEFNRIPSQSLNGIIDRVSYPALSTLQDDPTRLKAAYEKLIQTTMYVTFILMLGLAATADRTVLVLLGKPWLPVAPYLRLLCFVGMMYPLQALNLNMLKVKGRSDLFLRLEVIKKVLSVPALVLGAFFGIKVLIAGMIVNALAAYYLNSSWSGRLVGYPVREQLAGLGAPFFLSAGMGLLAYLTGRVIIGGPLLVLAVQAAVGAVVVLAFSEAARLKPYLEIKRIVLESVRR